MARPPKPIELLKLTGTDREDRHGGRAVEPQSGGLPQKPTWLVGEGESFWLTVVPMLERMKVVQSIDTFELAAMCRWWSVWRRLDRRLEELEDDEDAYKLIIQCGLAWKSFDKIASKYGFSPVDRVKLATSKDEGSKNPLLDMLKRRQGAN